MKPFIKPRPAQPSATPPAPAARISPNELTLFSVAASVADPAERAAYLDRACGSDTELRARLEERLQARARAASPVAAAPVAATAPDPGPAPHIIAAAPAPSAELVKTVRETALTGVDRPDALALVPMSAMQFAAAQQPPRHSPIPWFAATILALAAGALAVFFMTERKTRVEAEREAQSALNGQSEAERQATAAAAEALEAKTIASRAEQARQAALQEKDATAAEATKARAEAAKNLAEREQAVANLKAATDKTQAAEAEVVKLRGETAAGQRAWQVAFADSLGRLGAAQMESRAYGEAETNLRQALQLREQLKTDSWAIVETRALLGSALMQRSQDGEALQQFQTAAAAFEALGPPANDNDRARASAASKRIVQFFTVTGRRKDAVEWRRRLEAVLAAR